MAKRLGDAFQRDRRGRALPVWQGCGAVQPGDVFLMNPQVQDYFDGRYFGLLPASDDRRSSRASLDREGALTMHRKLSPTIHGHITKNTNHLSPSRPCFGAVRIASSSHRRGLSAFAAAVIVDRNCGAGEHRKCANGTADALSPRRPVVIIFREYIADAAQRFGVPASWIRAIMHAESDGNVRASFTKRRDGADANHAVDLDGSARPLRLLVLIPLIRTTISWPAPRSSENCTTATDARLPGGLQCGSSAL